MSRLSIRSKLLIMLLGVSLGSIGVFSYYAFRSGDRAITERIFAQLTSVRASKASQLESYLKSVRNQVETLGEDHMIASAMRGFRDAFAELHASEIPAEWDEAVDTYYRTEYLPRLTQNVEGTPVFEIYRPTAPASRHLQYEYIAGNAGPVGEKQALDAAQEATTYNALHATYHPILRRLAERFGFYDLFLIDIETGEIVYSVYKETDFATNLRTGPYSNTNLAEVFAKVRETPDKGFVKVVDFAPYRPSYAAPAAFIATPIYDGYERLGVLALQLPVDELNRIMTGDQMWTRDGLGETGETYLVGRDYLMRSVSRFLVEDREAYAVTLRAAGTPEPLVQRILQLDTSILQQAVRTDATVAALEGKAGTRITKDYRGTEVLSSYAPLDVPDVDWVVLSEMDLAEAYAPVRSFTRQMLVAAGAIMLVVSGVAMALAFSFLRPITALTEGARRVGSGETDVIVEANAGDEFGELASSFNEMVAGVRTQTKLVAEKNRENEDLLLAILPAPIASRLKQGETQIADSFENVTVLFSDLVGFTGLTRVMSPQESVALLNDLVSAFDDAAERHGVEKIKTMGDGYMAASGLSTPRLDHAKRAVDFALEMLGIVRRFNNERRLDLKLRIGVNSGPIVAGVVGRNKFLYDLWGDTVNSASRLQNAAEPGEVRVSRAIQENLRDLYHFEQGPPVRDEPSWIVKAPAERMEELG